LRVELTIAVVEHKRPEFHDGKNTWNATEMFLSRKKSSNEKTEGPSNARDRNWDAKYGYTSNHILYIKVS
jgi:hypothetical protein